jgi:hypothetical protein
MVGERIGGGAGGGAGVDSGRWCCHPLSASYDQPASSSLNGQYGNGWGSLP